MVKRSDRNSLLLLQLIALLGLNLAYITAIGDLFGYQGFQMVFSTERFIIGTLVLLSALSVGYFVTKPYFSTVWNVVFTYLLAGQVIFYQYNPEVEFVQIIPVFACLLFIALLSRTRMRISRETSIRNPDAILGVIAVILFLPFLVVYAPYVRVSNLLFQDVYSVRQLFGGLGNAYFGYMMAPLARILLPVLIVMKLEKKQFKLAALYMLMVCYLFLCGALKSTLMGLGAILFFYFGTFVQKTRFFLRAVALLSYGGWLVYRVFGNIFLIDTFIRRVFFIPANLGNMYYDLFKGNLTYMSHSPFGLGFRENLYGSSITEYVGQLRGTGSNYSVGLITEGTFSFGLMGGVIAALLVAVILLYFWLVSVDQRYFGIVFAYVYYMSTALLSYLLLTHGLLFLMVISYMFLGNANRSRRVQVERRSLHFGVSYTDRVIENYRGKH